MTTPDVAELIGRLTKALADCADDLEAEVRDRWCYCDGRPLPAMQPKFDRDMQPVDQARTVLTEARAYLSQPPKTIGED